MLIIDRGGVMVVCAEVSGATKFLVNYTGGHFDVFYKKRLAHQNV